MFKRMAGIAMGLICCTLLVFGVLLFVGSEVQSVPDPALIAAAKQGDVVGVKRALDEGTDINITDQFGRTALMWAAFEGHAEISKELLARNANVLMKDTDGETSLLFASAGSSPAILKALLERGAKVDIRAGEAHWTPLMFAVWNRRPANVRLLVRGGAALNARDNRGRTGLLIAQEAQYPDMVNLLKQAGAKEKP